jgi:hypothetical protein
VRRAAIRGRGPSRALPKDRMQIDRWVRRFAIDLDAVRR